MSRFLQSAACVLVAFVICCGGLFMWFRYSMENTKSQMLERMQRMQNDDISKSSGDTLAS
jgi:cytochrome c-type biogenesis protein CcmH/NrfG